MARGQIVYIAMHNSGQRGFEGSSVQSLISWNQDFQNFPYFHGSPIIRNPIKSYKLIYQNNPGRCNHIPLRNQIVHTIAQPCPRPAYKDEKTKRHFFLVWVIITRICHFLECHEEQCSWCVFTSFKMGFVRSKSSLFPDSFIYNNITELPNFNLLIPLV